MSKTGKPRKSTNISNKKTALVLSGGGSRGAYQVGAWQALEELGWTFDMVVGVSVGALNGSMVVQGERLWAENLWRQLETDHIFDVSADAQLPDFALEFFRQGGAGSHGLHKFVDKCIDDERIRKSDIDFGLLTVEFPSRKPYYLWKDEIPSGQIGEYVMASSSAFPAIQVYEIDGKKFVDGGYENNMPVHMAVDRGATDIVAIYLDAVGVFDRDKELGTGSGANVTLIQPKWDLGNFLLFDRENTARIIRLGYLDAMKAFNVYDGNYYSFIKGDIEKKQIRYADTAAKVFNLDPLTLYSKDLLMGRLKREVDSASNEFSDLIEVGRSVIKRRNIDLKKAREALGGVNNKVATILIARDLKERKETSIFLNRYALRILGDDIVAARYIERNNLI